MSASKQYITLVDALGEPGKALLDRDLEAEQIQGQITYREYLHLKREQLLVREYRGYSNRRLATNGGTA